MELVFWASVGLMLYVYVGYPALLGVWAWLKAPRDEDVPTPAAMPGVTVIIAARNEALRLPARIENLLASDYPADRLQIVVASDGSTDRTADALAPYGSRVELILLPPGGKARALNAAAARARHPILVFADARQRFAPDAIRRLVRHFSRLSIGAVSGELVLDCEAELGLDATPQAELKLGATTDGRPNAVTPSSSSASSASTVGDGVGLYWRYEKWLRRRESIVDSTLGVTGAIYAMRRSLWQPLPPDTLLDDVLAPMRVVLQGYRVIFDGSARAYDETSKDALAEMRRKVRTLAGNFQLIAQEPRLLVPGLNRVWFQFTSHKLARLAAPYALLATLVSSAWLAPASLLYASALAAQAGLYGLAAYGALLDRRARRNAVASRATAAREPAVYAQGLRGDEAA